MCALYIYLINETRVVPTHILVKKAEELLNVLKVFFCCLSLLICVSVTKSWLFEFIVMNKILLLSLPKP